MRGSDIVDLLLNWLPKRWVRVGLFVLFLGMVVTHCYEPVTWYVLDKARGLTEQFMPVVQQMLVSLATSTPTPVAR